MLTKDAQVFLAIIAVIAVLAVCAWLALRRRERDLALLAKEKGWQHFREKPRTEGTWIDPGIRGKYRGYAFGAYKYKEKTRQDAEGRPITSPYAAKPGWVIRVKVSAPLPNCVVNLVGLDELRPDGVVLPEFEEWFRENASRCSAFEAANDHLTVRGFATMNRDKLLRTLDFLVDVAEQLPIHQS
ncbi:hypothetical protein [Amycolatopsis sp. GM8]|uniref:hypothetical protein n=1 Tax=Amycolatopsis sp. GM8 TaxID=2896530 RepID=UPI001F284EEC|nr:hypothetical protein [Amycolatopsis sp. GM8]